MHARDRTTPVAVPVHRAAQMRGGRVAAIDVQTDRLDDVHRGHHPGDHRLITRQELGHSPVGDRQRFQFGRSVQHALVVHLRA